MIRFITFLILCFFIALPAQAKSFITIEEVVGETGVKAWLVQDKTVPVISISLMFKTGATADPHGKAGLASFASVLMDEGAGDINAQAFQKKLKDEAISYSFSAGRDGFYGQVKTVRDNKNIAIDLLTKALTQPRFDDDAIERMRSSLLTSLRYDEQEASWHAQKALFDTLYDGHPYARLIKGTPASLKTITRDDLVNFHRRTITRDNVILGMAGDITTTEAKQIVDTLFATIPETATRPDLPMADLKLDGQTHYTPWDGPQAVIMMAQKGIARSDENWFTAQLLNYILGGGGFSSRLMDEIRVKRGLTYGVSTGIIDYKYGPLLMGQASVSKDKIAETIDVIKDQWAVMAQQGVTEKELADAKAYLIGSLPLALSSSDAIADLLIQMQDDHLAMTYLDYRADDINKVTLDQINQFAKIWLATDALSFVVAGSTPKN